MALIQSFEKSGNLLFKYRGQIPILIFVLAVPILTNSNQHFYACLANGQYAALRVIFTFVAILLTLCGLVVRAYTVSTTPKGTSGRNTDKQVAKHLNTDGIYSIVRHPLYFANYLIWAGLLVFTMNIWAILLVSLVYWIYYERIMFAEEAFLRAQFGLDFETWAARVPAFLPRFSLFHKEDMTFSFKTFLRREYVTIFSTVFSYTVVDYLLFVLIAVQNTSLSALTCHQWMRPSFYIMMACFVVMLILRTLKHHSDILKSDATRD